MQIIGPRFAKYVRNFVTTGDESESTGDELGIDVVTEI